VSACTSLVAVRNVGQIQRLYEGGQRTLQDVLDARIEAISREDDLNEATTDAALATVRLYLALGGGWSPDDASSVSAAANP
jgi:outer membrane protein TolC